MPDILKKRFMYGEYHQAVLDKVPGKFPWWLEEVMVREKKQ